MEESAERTSISIFPVHRRIIEEFAGQDHRSFSNAVQFIIEDWARLKRAAIHAAAPTEPVETYMARPEAEVR
jgi:hypothetical protein